MSMVRQFKVPGIYLSDIAKYTGYSNVKKACESCGVKLWKLTDTVYQPLSVEQAYRVIKWIRANQHRQLELFR